jgi:MFS family permease
LSKPDPLFTARFFVMCAFTFTVFLSAFMLFPTAPFRIVSLGGTKFAAGLFLGLLTYASALSAPFTGGLADRIGRRRMLVVCGLALDRMDARGFSPQAAAILNATAVLVAVFHFWTFAHTLRRYVTGWAVDRRWFEMITEPSWQPPGGTLLSLAGFAVMLLVALWLLRRAVRAERRAAEPAV